VRRATSGTMFAVGSGMNTSQTLLLPSIALCALSCFSLAAGCSDAGEPAAQASENSASTSSPVPDTSLLFCEGPEVLHTGINKRFLTGTGYHDGYFYTAGEGLITRVAATGGEPEDVVTPTTTARYVYFTDAHIVRITEDYEIEVLDYSGAPLGALDAHTYYVGINPEGTKVYSVVTGETVTYWEADLTTLTSTEHTVDLGESGWLEDFQTNEDFSWDFDFAAGSLFISSGYDFGHIYRLDLGTDRLERFAADVTSGYFLGGEGNSVYITTSWDDEVEVPETYEYVLATGERTAIEALHGNTSIAVSFWVGFDNNFYYRDTGPFYAVDGAEATYIGSVESDCLRDGIGMVDGKHYAFMHPSGSNTEVVIRQLVAD
jgi:hypothetical protein